jgi:hypothetical protein
MSNIYLIFKIYYKILHIIYHNCTNKMYDIKWGINYSYYLTYSINELHCLRNIVINSKKKHIST